MSVRLVLISNALNREEEVRFEVRSTKFTNAIHLVCLRQAVSALFNTFAKLICCQRHRVSNDVKDEHQPEDVPQWGCGR